MATSTKWRVLFTANNAGSSYMEIADVQMRGTIGGADLCTGGTATADSGTPSLAFDASDTTNWDSAGGAFPHWIQYEFASAVEIVELLIRSDDYSGYTQYAPKDFQLQYWDGAAWQTVLAIAGEINWSVSQARTYSTVPKHAWRLLVTGSQSPAGYIEIAELEMHSSIGGANLCVGGASQASSSFGTGWLSSEAFDGNAATAWGSSAAVPQWIRYIFTSAVDVVEYSIRAMSATTYAPKTFKLQYSDGAGGWTDFDERINEPVWTAGEERTYGPAPTGNPMWYYEMFRRRNQ